MSRQAKPITDNPKQHIPAPTFPAGAVDPAGNYLLGDYVASLLGISEKALVLMAATGEFKLGRFAGKAIIQKKSLLEYLDRSHLVRRTSPEQELAVLSTGKVSATLTYGDTPHEEIPQLYGLDVFAERIGLKERSCIRHCDAGTFPHYRIGSFYKMSEDDWSAAFAFITETGYKLTRSSSDGADDDEDSMDETPTTDAAPSRRRTNRKKKVDQQASSTLQ